MIGRMAIHWYHSPSVSPACRSREPRGWALRSSFCISFDSRAELARHSCRRPRCCAKVQAGRFERVARVSGAVHCAADAGSAEILAAARWWPSVSLRRGLVS